MHHVLVSISKMIENRKLSVNLSAVSLWTLRTWKSYAGIAGLYDT